MDKVRLPFLIDSMKKKSLLNFIAHFEKELDGLLKSAKSAHQAATHEESRAEDRHDTFAIEASYLAAGQAERVKDLRRTLQELNQYLQSNTQSPISADLGVLIVLEAEGKKTYSLMLKNGGGTQTQVDGVTVTLLSPSSPLGDHVIGLVKGDSFTVENKQSNREHLILDLL
jgi:transcription elongation GreA/GreB family factor